MSPVSCRLVWFVACVGIWVSLILGSFHATRFMSKPGRLYSFQHYSSYSLAAVYDEFGLLQDNQMGSTPADLKRHVSALYEGRKLVLGDVTLFRSERLGLSPLSASDADREVSRKLTPELAKLLSRQADVELVYNPYEYFEGAKVGVPLPRRENPWPTKIHLLAPFSLLGEHARVLVFEAGRAVFFLPEEWLARPLVSAGSPWESIPTALREAMFMGLLWFAGFLFVCSAWGERRSDLLSASLAFPVGALLWVVCFWGLWALLGRQAVLERNGVALAFALFAVAAASPCLSRRIRLRIGENARSLCVGALAVLIVSLMSIETKSMFFTFDSFRMLSHYLDPQVSLQAGFPVVLPAIQALRKLTGGDFVASVFPLFYVSLMGTAGTLAWLLRGAFSRRFLLLLVSVALFFALFVAPGVSRIHMTYFNGHVLMANLLMAVFVFLTVEQRRVPGLNVASSQALVGLGLLLGFGAAACRVEGALLIACELGCWFAVGLSRLGSRFSPFAVGVLVGAFAWSCLFASLATGSSFVSDSQSLLVAGGLIGLLLHELFLPKRGGGALLAWLGRRGLLMGLVLVMGAVFALKPTHMWMSSESVFRNMLEPALGWGYFWWLAIALGIFLLCSAVSSRRDSGAGWSEYGYAKHLGDFCILFFLAAFTLILALGFFRTPYKVAWLDSGNRVLFQVSPFLVVGLLVRIGISFRRFEKSSP